MILSASRRTDIPNYYSDWFYNRIKEGYVLVRNPMNFHQVSKVPLVPDVVDCIVFWTKNPRPMLQRLDELQDYSYYSQFTLNSYGTDIEPNVPSKNDQVIPAFQELSQKIGADRVIWRYDPILINHRYTLEYHARYFEEIAKKLKGCTRKCTISFIDFYRSISKNVKDLGLLTLDAESMRNVASCLSEIAFRYDIKMDICSETVDLKDIRITRTKCIDDQLIEKITGYKIHVEKDKNQRPDCCCAASVDVGAYNTCLNGCRYCYATHHTQTAEKNHGLHDSSSPLLFGTLSEEDVVKERKVKSCREYQLSF